MPVGPGGTLLCPSGSRPPGRWKAWVGQARGSPTRGVIDARPPSTHSCPTLSRLPPHVPAQLRLPATGLAPAPGPAWTPAAAPLWSPASPSCPSVMVATNTSPTLHLLCARNSSVTSEKVQDQATPPCAPILVPAPTQPPLSPAQVSLLCAP